MAVQPEAPPRFDENAEVLRVTVDGGEHPVEHLGFEMGLGPKSRESSLAAAANAGDTRPSIRLVLGVRPYAADLGEVLLRQSRTIQVPSEEGWRSKRGTTST